MAKASAMETREFRLDKHAITMLIEAQAGSLQKAALEAVANAIDAGASRVKVTLRPDRLDIEDDGKGFASVGSTHFVRAESMICLAGVKWSLFLVGLAVKVANPLASGGAPNRCRA